MPGGSHRGIAKKPSIMPVPRPGVLIQVDSLRRSYGSRVGVESIDLELEAGTIFGFLGPNGAGKTTTIRLLLGFLHPTGGEARVFGLDSWRDSHRIKRDVGYLPSDLRLYGWMTAESALRVAGRIRGMDLLRAGHEVAERFELEPDVRVRAMSRGMRQKLGIVLALAHRPRLLILDEPTSGLDPLMQDELARALREQAEAGRGVFLSSHTLSEVETICDRVAIVRRGRIVADESLEQLRHRARRTVELSFASAEACARVEPPAVLALRKRDGRRWTGELVGPAGALREWLAAQPIEDFSVSPPDLEALFRGFYREGEDG